MESPLFKAKPGIASKGICGFRPSACDFFMPDPDPIPRLRVVDDEEKPDSPGEVVRLKAGNAPAPSTPTVRVAPMPALPEHTERLEGETREHFEGRSIEPGIDAILEPLETPETLEQTWGGEETRVRGLPYGWVVLLALLVLGAAVWSFRAMRQGEAKVAQDQQVLRGKEERDEKEDATARRLVDAVEATLKQYLAADTLEKILPVVRDPARVKPLIEETWAQHPPVPLKFDRMPIFQPRDLNGKPFWAVQVEVVGGPPQILMLEQTGETEVKVDWESHVFYQPMPWDRFAVERPTGQSFEFRVMVEAHTHYSHEFSDSGKWRCFRLTARNSTEHVFGYVPAGSELMQMLDFYCGQSPGKVAPLILKLRVPEQSSSPRGVVIEGVTETGWIRAGTGKAGGSP